MRPDLYIDDYRPADRAALYDVCLRTGNVGADAGPDHEDRDLLGHVYLGPYLELEPELTLVLRAAGSGGPVGYAVATADTATFEAACEERWWPPLRAHYRARPPRPGSADARLVRMIEDGVRTEGPWLAEHPAHLHVDLLEPARGVGAGRALLTRLFAALEDRGVPGVHLEVASANDGAVAFYRRLGFTVVAERPDSLVMARRLAPAAVAS
ncbi:Acetyltransferase (GNAT) family protein [Georgenia satyanarayanai]|uniref:Acetyltransferase (GNAT) family protein n=1 Tax=Georgenia satyanarayanai TaxID=860221 RepID=A0A2Y9A4G8_9MICO|nr:GNAT family N-acetyltransferase [Georgenia satyanarayanai]PYG00866.1 acetyltransferase (GNAT) family protein [Georgenia satyanarayanai]SSA39105.1 Acetyltransferase (GNAT) family protein [Georgenia satyanarayanai]